MLLNWFSNVSIIYSLLLTTVYILVYMAISDGASSDRCRSLVSASTYASLARVVSSCNEHIFLWHDGMAINFWVPLLSFISVSNVAHWVWKGITSVHKDDFTIGTFFEVFMKHCLVTQVVGLHRSGCWQSHESFRVTLRDILKQFISNIYRLLCGSGLLLTNSYHNWLFDPIRILSIQSERTNIWNDYINSVFRIWVNKYFQGISQYQIPAYTHPFITPSNTFVRY